MNFHPKFHAIGQIDVNRI